MIDKAKDAAVLVRKDADEEWKRIAPVPWATEYSQLHDAYDIIQANRGDWVDRTERKMRTALVEVINSSVVADKEKVRAKVLRSEGWLSALDGMRRTPGGTIQVVGVEWGQMLFDSVQDKLQEDRNVDVRGECLFESLYKASVFNEEGRWAEQKHDLECSELRAAYCNWYEGADEETQRFAAYQWAGDKTPGDIGPETARMLLAVKMTFDLVPAAKDREKLITFEEQPPDTRLGNIQLFLDILLEHGSLKNLDVAGVFTDKDVQASAQTIAQSLQELDQDSVGIQLVSITEWQAPHRLFMCRQIPNLSNLLIPLTYGGPETLRWYADREKINVVVMRPRTKRERESGEARPLILASTIFVNARRGIIIKRVPGHYTPFVGKKQTKPGKK